METGLLEYDPKLAEIVRRLVEAYQALCGTGTAADVLVCTRSYFEARRHLRASLPGTVLREGKLLHAA